MADNLPRRMCDGCGQVWSSGSFLDPTTEASCGVCGEPLLHRRSRPNGVVVKLDRVTETQAQPMQVRQRTAVG